MSHPDLQRFETGDGVSIAYRDQGRGRVVLLLHGYIADSVLNWLEPGIAARLLEAGFRVLMPDLRGHGASVRSHRPSDYPRDAFARDQLELLAALQIEEYDLVGYSLGAMVAARVQALDDRARALVLAGSAEDGILERGANWEPFLRALADPAAARGRDGERQILEFVAASGGDPEALRLCAECRETSSAQQLSAFRARTLLLSGREDHYIESLEPLQKLIPGSEIERPPGDHLGAVSHPEFARALVGFLSRD